MITNNYIVWRNTPNNKTETNRVLLNLKHIKSISTKSSKFSTSKLVLNLNKLSSWNSQSNVNEPSYIQLAFKNGADSRTLFFGQLQTLIQNHNKTEDDQKNASDDTLASLINVVNREDIIDDIYTNYKSISQFLSIIKSKLVNNTHLVKVINKLLTEHDDKTHHLKSYHTLTEEEQSIMVKFWFKHVPYIKLSEYKKHAIGKEYLLWLLFNSIICRLYVNAASFSKTSMFPVADMQSMIQQKWIEQLLKCTWYYNVDDTDTNKRCTDLLDIWMNKIWQIHHLKMDGITFTSYDNNEELSYDNLFIISHLFKNYTKSARTKVEFSFNMLTNSYPRITKIKGYDRCFVDILNLKVMEWNNPDNFAEHLQDVHGFMVELLIKYGFSSQQFIIRELRNWIKYNEGYDNCYLKYYKSLHLQNYLKDDNFTQDDIIKIIENILLIDPDYLDSSWSGLYFGLSPLRYLKYESELVEDSDRIIKYIQDRLEMFQSIEDGMIMKSDTEPLSPTSCSKEKKKKRKRKDKKKEKEKEAEFKDKNHEIYKSNKYTQSKKEDDSPIWKSSGRRQTAPTLTSFPLPDTVTQEACAETEGEGEGDEVSDDENSNSSSRSPISEMEATDKESIIIEHTRSMPAPPSLPGTEKNDISTSKSMRIQVQVQIPTYDYDEEKHSRLNRSRKKRRSYERRKILKSTPPIAIDVSSVPSPRIGSRCGSGSSE